MREELPQNPEALKKIPLLGWLAGAVAALVNAPATAKEVGALRSATLSRAMADNFTVADDELGERLIPALEGS